MESIFSVLFGVALIALPVLAILQGRSSRPRWTFFALSAVLVIHGVWFSAFVSPSTWTHWIAAVAFILAAYNFASGLKRKAAM